MDLVYEVSNLRKEYKQCSVIANDNLSFDIYPGEIFGLLGPNGAGKTTLVRQLVGLLKPTSGAIRLFGSDIVASAATVPEKVAYIAQKPFILNDVPVETAVMITGHIRGLIRQDARQEARRLLGLLQLEGSRRQIIKRLSGGQQRLLSLALVLIGNLPVLVLDEPTNDLDPENRRLVWDILLEKNRAGTTIILVTHNVLEAEKVIQRVGIINQGKIMALGDVGGLKARVDQRMRLELLLYRNGESTNNITLQFLETITGGEVLQQGSNHYIVLVERHRLEEVIGLVISTVGMDNLNDFRILTPSLEDVYMQLGGGKDLVTAN